MARIWVLYESSPGPARDVTPCGQHARTSVSLHRTNNEFQRHPAISICSPEFKKRREEPETHRAYGRDTPQR